MAGDSHKNVNNNDEELKDLPDERIQHVHPKTTRVKECWSMLTALRQV